MVPSFRGFRELSRRGWRVPVGVSLPLEADPRNLFRALKFSSPCILLESARLHPVTGRYSILVGEPEAVLLAWGRRIRIEQAGASAQEWRDPLGRLRRMLEERRALRLPGLPPFVGGAVGFVGFDAYRLLEGVAPKGTPLGSERGLRRLAPRAQDDLGLPDLGFLFCDRAVVVDHGERKLWGIVLAPATGDPAREYERARAEAEALLLRATSSGKGGVSEEMGNPLRRDHLGTRPFGPRWTHTRAEFEEMVRRAKSFIADGEIYQANLSQRLTVPLAGEPWELYERLTRINPSPFAAFADFGPFQVVSASPERFLRVRGGAGAVETRPIAGTRPRGRSAAETALLRRELILNEKERAEHVMLVDLERNDLGRVARYGSVRVTSLMELEEYSHVIHIVSNVRGRLRAGVGVPELLAATFPGGTISGCPKVRCLEIIDALEPVRRGLYTGSLGYVSAAGEMDLNLLIRTAVISRGEVHVQVGAGIVADSDPGREYEETQHKAQALLEALRSAPRAGEADEAQLVLAGS